MGTDDVSELDTAQSCENHWGSPRMQKASAAWQKCWMDIIGASLLAWFIRSKTMKNEESKRLEQFSYPLKIRNDNINSTTVSIFS